MHRYQRKDSAWANEYTTSLKDYAIGFQSKTSEILPAFIKYNCINDKIEQIKPSEKRIVLKNPEDFQDHWEDPPRHSLMLAVKHEVFDNLLGGNFMKTTLHGKWTGKGVNFLSPDFLPYVAKYADGGGTKSKKELARYFEEYTQRILSENLQGQLAK